MTVRKNFVFDEKVARHLEELAKESKKSMTILVQEMIENAYSEIEKRKKIAAFESIKGSMTNAFSEYAPDDNKVIQKIKRKMDV